MKNTVICYVRGKNGNPKKYKSKKGENFRGPDGVEYNAPVDDNYEILELEGFWGTKRQAFYVEGQVNAIPLSKEGAWAKTTSHSRDVDMLIDVTREALLEAGQAEMKANVTMIGQVVVLVAIIIHHLWG